jgi:hypothetical protein
VLLHNVVGVNDVSTALGHFLAVAAENHSLVHQLHEGLGVVHDADVVQHLVPEACVQQVQHGVLLSADV